MRKTYIYGYTILKEGNIVSMGDGTAIIEDNLILKDLKEAISKDNEFKSEEIYITNLCEVDNAD